MHRSNCDLSAANTLRTHYKRPYFLPPVAESSKTDWIFMGSPGYGAHMHVRASSLNLCTNEKKNHSKVNIMCQLNAK